MGSRLNRGLTLAPRSPQSLRKWPTISGLLPASGYLSINGRQPSDSKFDLTVGELTPIFDNARISTDRAFIEDLAGLSPSFLQRQPEIFMRQVVIVALVAKSARPIRDTVRSSHCVRHDVWGEVVSRV